MTNEEKIAQGLCTAQTNAETGEVTIIPFTDEEIAAIQSAPAKPQPTVADLQAQLATIQAQLTALIPKA
jgi:hypothetical protein